MAALDKTPVRQSLSLPKWLQDLIHGRVRDHAGVRNFSAELTELLLASPAVAAYVAEHSSNGKTPPAVGQDGA